MKLIKTGLVRSLDQTMHICVEGPDTLNDNELKDIVTHWKEEKPHRLIL